MKCLDCGEHDENCECMECPDCNNLVPANVGECEICLEHDTEMSETDYAYEFDGRL